MAISIGKLEPSVKKHVPVDPAQVKAAEASVDQDVLVLKGIWNKSGDQSAAFKAAFEKLQADELALVKAENPDGPPQLPDGPNTPPHMPNSYESMASSQLYTDMQKVDGSSAYYPTLCKVWNKDSGLAFRISSAEEQMDADMAQGDLTGARQQQAILKQLQQQASSELNPQPKRNWLQNLFNEIKNLF